MKTHFKAAMARGGWLILLAATALTVSGNALATGTTAGTTISNKATLNYSVGAVAQPVIASSPTGSSNGTGVDTNFVVDNKISHTVVTTDTAAVASIPGQTAVVTTFTVTNTGNKAQDYALAVSNLAAGAQTIFAGSLTDNFDVTTASCVVRVNGVTQSYVGSLAADASATVTVSCPIAATQVNNDVAGVLLTAAAAGAGTNGTPLLTQTPAGSETAAGEDIVFADAASAFPIPDVDVARDGKATARSAYRVVTASLVVTKVATTMCDPLNGATNPKNIPGAYVQYVVTITNGGSSSATLTTVTDVLSTNVTFDGDLITTTGGAATCIAGNLPQSGTAGKGFKVIYTLRGGTYPRYLTTLSDGDGGTNTAGTLSIDFTNALPAVGTYAAGELKAGESMQLVYQVRIN
jgi:uncharacterized repeat protein (TIGR01451 family)